MLDDITHQERLERNPPSGLRGILQGKEREPEQEEISCGAFGFLRGLKEQPASVEFRFQDGTSKWFPYGWMGPWQHDPSQGLLLLKFTGDLVYLVLIHGANFDLSINDGATNLTHFGLQRHRVSWIREMSQEEIRQVGEAGPTIDKIEVGEFESHAALKEWLGKHAPAFAEGPRDGTESFPA
jgi:hypothetical protein